MAASPPSSARIEGVRVIPYNGEGTFSPVYNWQTDKANGIKIRADRMDGQDGDIATGLSTAITRDGQSPATANLPMATFKHTGVGAASARTDYLRASQAQDNDLTTFTTTGTIDSYLLTPAPAITALVPGLSFFVRWHATSQSTTPVINISGLGAGTIANGDLSALAAGDLVADGRSLVTYSGTAGFLLPNKGASSIFGLADGGSKVADFTAANNSRYTVYPGTAGLGVTMPNSSTGAGKFIMFVKIGPYAMNLCGTVNGATSTVSILDRQTLTVGCTTVDGWD